MSRSYSVFMLALLCATLAMCTVVSANPIGTPIPECTSECFVQEFWPDGTVTGHLTYVNVSEVNGEAYADESSILSDAFAFTVTCFGITCAEGWIDGPNNPYGFNNNTELNFNNDTFASDECYNCTSEWICDGVPREFWNETMCTMMTGIDIITGMPTFDTAPWTPARNNSYLWNCTEPEFAHDECNDYAVCHDNCMGNVTYDWDSWSWWNETSLNVTNWNDTRWNDTRWNDTNWNDTNLYNDTSWNYSNYSWSSSSSNMNYNNSMNITENGDTGNDADGGEEEPRIYHAMIFSMSLGSEGCDIAADDRDALGEALMGALFIDTLVEDEWNDSWFTLRNAPIVDTSIPERFLNDSSFVPAIQYDYEMAAYIFAKNEATAEFILSEAMSNYELGFAAAVFSSLEGDYDSNVIPCDVTQASDLSFSPVDIECAGCSGVAAVQVAYFVLAALAALIQMFA